MNQLTTLAIQSWIFYAVSFSLIFSRLIFRRRTLSHFKKFQADDWLMVLILLPYTTSIVAANQVGDATSAKERKFRYILEEMQILTVWLVKACLLVLYWRIFPVESSVRKRRLIQGVSAFCCAAFLVVQLSLMLWCQPTEAYWKLSSNNPQCSSYHAHTTLALALSIPTTLLTMLLPVPFIPTPRRLLLAILLLISTLVLITGIVGHASILTNPQKPTYLYYYTTESSLGIFFANLPFLTSLVTPSRIRHLSSQLSLSQWPRSRQQSWTQMPPRTSRLNSTATTIGSPVDVEKAAGWSGRERQEEGARLMGDAREMTQIRDTARTRDSTGSSHESVRDSSPAIPSPPVVRPKTSDSQVPKTRLSGGLAEMGDLSLNDTTQGWPIYWR